MRLSTGCVRWLWVENYFVTNSEAKDHSAAMRYTLLMRDKLNGLDPNNYLCHVQSVITDHPISCIDELPLGCESTRSRFHLTSH